jgi:hypothetical protein
MAQRSHPYPEFERRSWLWSGPVSVETNLIEKDSILLGTLTLKLDRHIDEDTLLKAAKLKLYFRTGQSFICTEWREGQTKKTFLAKVGDISEYSFLPGEFYNLKTNMNWKIGPFPCRRPSLLFTLMIST